MFLIPDLKDAGVEEVILNPGAESDELIEKLKLNKINPLMVCSIRIIGFDPADL